MIKTIGLITPSYFPTDEQITKIKHFLENEGFRVIVSPFYSKWQVFAGTKEERIKGIEELYKNKDVDCIISIKGGYGCLSLVDNIDYNIIKANPKPLLGFSDMTALHTAIIKHVNVVTYHAPNATNLVNGKINKESVENLLAFLKGHSTNLSGSELLKNVHILKHGKAEGKSIGGNLSLLQETIGTKIDPDFDNKILFIEDAGMEILEVYNKLLHLKRADKLKNIKGIVVGEMVYIGNCEKDFTMNCDDIIKDIFDEYKIPIVTNFPFGHGKNNIVIPLNANFAMDTKKDLFKFYES